MEFLFCFVENAVLEVRSPWWHLLFAPHFSYSATEQFSISRESTGDPQVLPNLYTTSLGFETFGKKTLRCHLLHVGTFPVLPHADISHTPDFQHSVFLPLCFKRAHIPVAQNADGLWSFVIRRAQKTAQQTLLSTDVATGDKWETCVAFGNIPFSVICSPDCREAWLHHDLLLFWLYKKKQRSKLQFDLQDLTVVGTEVNSYFDWTSVFPVRFPKRGTPGLSNSFL